MPSASLLLGAAVVGIALSSSLVNVAYAQPRGPSVNDAERLAMAAQASGRPKECRSTDRSRRRMTVWDRARQPHLQRYCDLLGRAHLQLDRAASSAREAARLADQVLPGKAAPWVLIGRAHVRLRDYQQAIKDFTKARSLDPRCIEDPASLRDVAIAERETGRLDDARMTYRILVPRLGLLPDTDDRVAVLLDAASLAMHKGPAGLGEAAALLREARAQPLSAHDAIVLAMLALTLDRAGMRQESNAVLETIYRSNMTPRLLSADIKSLAFLVDPNEWNAVLALVLEGDDRTQAIDAWERYLKAKAAPMFSAHATARLDEARRGAPRRGTH